MTTLTGATSLSDLPETWRPRASTLLHWALVDWSIIAAGWWLLSAFDNVYVSVGATLMIAGRLHALGVILHDACHRPTAGKTFSWWLVEALAGWPIASTTDAMRYHHLRHHRYSGTSQDPYRRPLSGTDPVTLTLLCLRGLLLPPWWTLRAVFAPIALAFPAARNVYGRAFLQDRSGEDLQNHQELLRCARADLAQLAAQAAVLAIAIGLDLPIVSHYLIPLLIAGVLNAHRIVREHTPDELDKPTLPAVIATTRNSSAGWVGNWLFYPHNIGLHVAHHLQPGVAFVHLPDVDARLGAVSREQARA